jgi:hypothetical protein
MTSLTKINFSKFHAQIIIFINSLNLRINSEEIEQVMFILRVILEAENENEKDTQDMSTNEDIS